MTLPFKSIFHIRFLGAHVGERSVCNNRTQFSMNNSILTIVISIIIQRQLVEIDQSCWWTLSAAQHQWLYLCFKMWGFTVASCSSLDNTDNKHCLQLSWCYL